ncbi:MAG: B12-binding domain-containing radical SAM protein [Nitrospirae bacterium]|nr:B12-binding domain-containing radical SAM protein [Nitrospirota bacterium]
MRITLIAPTPPDVSAFGIRALSSYLKKHGKEVRLIFLPGGVEKFKYKTGFKYEYEKSILDQVVELCKGSGLVGVSFMSNYLDRAVQICEALNNALDVPIMTGGIHPTVMPESCLSFSDIVCVGEGEEAVLELVQRLEEGKDYTDIRNLQVKRGGKIYRNELRPLIQDLDSLPFYDFGTEGHFTYDNITKGLAPMSKDLLKRSFPLEPHVEGSFNDSYKRTLSYKTMTTRGCPHHCTFCAEKTLSDLYKGQGYLRKRGISHIMDELLWVKREFPFVESIFLFDDTFLVRTTEEIREFSRAYKNTVGLPFHIQASPTTVTEEKMEALIDAGLAFVEMGIQSTSIAAKDLYKRKVPADTILRAAEVFRRYEGKIYPPCYHVILDNPWETPMDVVETLHLVLQLPRPFWLKRASLVCFPGTELYAKARQDGIITTEEDERREIYAKHLHTPKGTYVNFLMYLAGFSYFPRWIVRFLSNAFFVRLFERPWLSGVYMRSYRLGETLIILSKGIRAFVKGDFSRIYRFFIKATSKTS